MALVLRQKEYQGKFFDNISGEKVGLFYRRATTKEKNKFNSAMANLILKHQETKDRETFIDDNNELQEEWGDKVLVGIADGDFYLDEESEQTMSSDDKSENYYPGWRAVIKEERPELLRALCNLVFSEVRHLPGTEKKRTSQISLENTTELL
jgi:hypothetical protein